MKAAILGSCLKMSAKGRTRMLQREQPALRGRDATVVCALSKAHLRLLWRKLGNVVVVTHGLQDERYHCHELESHGSDTLYPRPVLLGRKEKRRGNYRDFFSQRQFQPSQIALALSGKHTDDKRSTASHLCDNTRCVRASHLVWESYKDNHARKGCAGEVVCHCCDTPVRVCRHDPPCLKKSGLTLTPYFSTPTV